MHQEVLLNSMFVLRLLAPATQTNKSQTKRCKICFPKERPNAKNSTNSISIIPKGNPIKPNHPTKQKKRQIKPTEPKIENNIFKKTSNSKLQTNQNSEHTKQKKNVSIFSRLQVIPFASSKTFRLLPLSICRSASLRRRLRGGCWAFEASEDSVAGLESWPWYLFKKRRSVR